MIARQFSVDDAEHTLTELLYHRNLVQIVRYFAWNAIEKDPDDNKFFDCAVAANADFIVTQDKHFDILKTIPFPSITAIKVLDFKQELGI